MLPEPAGQKRCHRNAREEAKSGPRSAYTLTRSILLRGLGVTYMAAFASMAVQVDGLIGSHGILPVADYLERARQRARPRPSDLLAATDFALAQLVRSGTARPLLGRFLTRLLRCFAGLLPGLSAILLWLSYLSIVVAGQIFLGYQWDSLLLEAGFLAVLIAPWRIRLGVRTDQPWWFAVWLLRWLVFRLMFQSGVVKLASHDPNWWSLSALDFHYETQPLARLDELVRPPNASLVPPSFGGYSCSMPSWWRLSSSSDRDRLRLVGFASMVLLQLLIAGTGNYGFFNLLSIILCLSLLDDRDWEWLNKLRLPRRNTPTSRPRLK